MRRILLVIVVLCIFMTGCNKKGNITVDDSWYIVDDYKILMFCKDLDQSYKELVYQMKGNGNQIEVVIEELKKMKQSVPIKNAIGIGYLRLRRFDEANYYFNQALKMEATIEEKACILTNLSECVLYQENWDQANEYVKEASELEVRDSVMRLVLKSNLLSEQLSDSNALNIIAKEKKLLKEGKKLFGSNQFIGIFNYKVLAIACYYADNMKRCDYYMEKALKLNEDTYKYSFVEANLQNIFSSFYSSTDFTKTLEHENKCIDILEKWQTKNHNDLLQAYVNRGNIYFNNHNTIEAIQDYKIVLERCTVDNKLAAVTYYNLGNAYNYSLDSDNAIKCFSKAYYLWQKEGCEDNNSDIIDNLKQLYYCEHVTIDFDSWFEEKLSIAKEDLERQ